MTALSAPVCTVELMNAAGEVLQRSIPRERPLTVYLDRLEIVTLMTLGDRPEWLTLGYLKNQGFIASADAIASLQVDWSVDAVSVRSKNAEQISKIKEKMTKRTVTTGCGQGSMYGDILESARETVVHAQRQPILRSEIYALLDALRAVDSIYKQAGSVHACALCGDANVFAYVEDIGRHNAVDALAGWQWLQPDQASQANWMYTTGRLTSEMVLKTAQMGIAVLISRSGVTEMGYELAKMLDITLIARANGKHFECYHGSGRMRFA